MKEIPLTKGKFSLVDDEDYEYLMQWKWCVSNANKKSENTYESFYAVRCDKFNIRHYMHLDIMKYHGYDLSANKVDHKDSDTLNNQKYNLRVSTNQQNLQNRRKKFNGKSRYKGIKVTKAGNRWQARIVVNKKDIHLGTYGSEIEAALAYNRAAIIYFGEFALLNEIKYA